MKISSGIPAISKLVEQQLRNWELARIQRPGPAASERPEVEDFVCVSRQVGVDGERVAAVLGRELGWPVFGREILDAMAGDDPTRMRIYTSLDERDLTWWEEAVRAVLDRGFIRNDYFRRLSETVLSLARKGTSVFVGRGADLILPRHLGFRVRLAESREKRLARFAAAYGLEPAVADRRLDEVERKRGEFLKNHFGVEAADPLRYDLIVNLDRWTIEDAAALALEARSLRRGSRSART